MKYLEQIMGPSILVLSHPDAEKWNRFHLCEKWPVQYILWDLKNVNL